ncbi:hypothetical protein F5X68DRAFT_261749 [Plectosphaerella plurivora]|uniref:Uncharacterized protein n=1 Tax=Plectosphaerella plurivora TaxID=936078 RepID=A0A9P9A887_9PEZI|nr:hypothetical protein F5X68DRAFT_261749 [Plectosphaerella plurivora]
MDWERPGSSEIAVVGNFVKNEAPKISIGFAGTSRFDAELGEFVRPYARLDQALRTYMDEHHHMRVANWDNGISEQIAKMEKGYSNHKEGFWHSLWYKAGSHEESLNAWAGLIPDEYGLGVVKGGLAIIFMMAGRSVEKRQKIFDTFAALQEALIKAAHPEHARFRNKSAVIDSSESLYQTVVDSIEDLFHLLAANGRSRLSKLNERVRGSKQSQLLTSDEILERLQQSTKNYLEALDVARDQAIENTEMMGRYTGVRTVLIHEEVVANREGTARLEAGVQTYTTKVDAAREEIVDGIGSLNAGLTKVASSATYVKKRLDEDADDRRRDRERQDVQNQDLRDMMLSGLEEVKRIVSREGQGGSADAQQALGDQMSNRNLLMEVLLEERRRTQAQLSKLEKQLSQQSSGGAVVSFQRFCQILCQPSSRGPPIPPRQLEHMFQHPSRDLDKALAARCRFSRKDQGQVQSIFDNDKFLQWMERHHPGIISVDANLQAAALESISAVSAFCGTLVTSMLEVYPDDVVTHFFCGLHAHPGDDWFGPCGLIRSIVMQVLMKLVEMGHESLDFINNRGFLQELEEHDLHSLCATLHWLLYQFPPDTRVYCIIDSISCFDVDRQFRDLAVVMEALKEVVDDSALGCIFKVFVTTAGSSTGRYRGLGVFAADPGWLVELPKDNLTVGEMHDQEFERRLLRSPSPAHGRMPW